MHDERPHAYALITATGLAATTMALHPTGAQLLSDYAGTAPRNMLAHGLAMVGVPLSLMGVLPIGRRLRSAGASALADLAGIIYAVSNGAVLLAAVASGLLAPAIARRLLSSAESATEIWRTLFSFNGTMNQACALLYVIGLALSVCLWSLAMVRTKAFPKWIGYFGVCVSGALLLLLGVSRAHLDIHSFGLVVLLQGVWMVAVAVHCLRARA